MGRWVSLEEGVGALMADGATVAMEGFTHLIPHAAGMEVLRQGHRDLTLIRMTPDLIYDRLIGAGAVRKLVFSWGGNPGVGSLHRFRDAVENGWPRPLELEEHTHAGMAAAWAAGAANLPFGVLRAASGTDLSSRNPALSRVTCPFTGEELTAVRAHRPDVTVIHAQQGDEAGNVHLWGIVGIQREAALAARHVLVTVEERVERIVPRPGGVTLPAPVITHLAQVPGGAHPSYAQGYTRRDNRYYREWDAISRDRDRFRAWLRAEGVEVGG